MHQIAMNGMPDLPIATNGCWRPFAKALLRLSFTFCSSLSAYALWALPIFSLLLRTLEASIVQRPLATGSFIPFRGFNRDSKCLPECLASSRHSFCFLCFQPSSFHSATLLQSRSGKTEGVKRSPLLRSHILRAWLPLS